MADLPKTTISSLPAELLLLIFQFCYEDFRRDEQGHPQLMQPPWHYISEGLDPLSRRPTSASDLFDRFRSPTRFPFALAAVSPLWNDLLLMEKQYWTEIIYTFGSNASSVDLAEMVQRLERYPPNLPLNFIILKEGSGSSSDVAIQETEHNFQLDSLLTNYLNSRLLRFRSVVIEGRTGEFFLDAMRSRNSNTEGSLSSSILLIRRTDYTYHGRCNPQPQPLDQQYHLLKTLVIHGVNVEGFCPSMLNNQMSNLTRLIVSDYTFSRDQDSLLFTEFVRALHNLHNLDRLKLQNVSLRYTAEGNEFQFTCNVSHLHLDSVPRSTATELYFLCRFPELHTLHITKCTYTAPEFPFQTQLLVLEDIEVETRDISGFADELGDWGGSALWLGGYPDYCEDFLDIFRRHNRLTDEFHCPWMFTLYLYRIENLSLKKLKKMLRWRNRDVDYDDPDWRVNTVFGPAIRKLTIDQCDIKLLKNRDIAWFSSRLVKFVYIP